MANKCERCGKDTYKQSRFCESCKRSIRNDESLRNSYEATNNDLAFVMMASSSSSYESDSCSSSSSSSCYDSSSSSSSCSSD